MALIECICPPTKAGDVRHPAGDTVELRERLDFAAGRTARNIVLLGKQEDQSTAEIMAALTEWYMIAGIRTWTVIDEKGKPVEPSRATITEYLFSHPDAAGVVGDEADELYSEAVMSPLVAPAWKPSPSTSTNGSTSATNGSSSKRPKPSKPSSTITTPTDATVTTSPSPAGVYS